MLTPLGELTKHKTREIARNLGLVTADKQESVEICFVPNDDYLTVLQQHLSADDPALAPGQIVTTAGEVVGQHQGYARYTIGQRRGLPGGFPEPMHVVRILPEERTIIIGTANDLLGNRVQLTELNWLGTRPAPSETCQIQVRYRSRPVPARILRIGVNDNDTVTLDLSEPVRAITPGQSGVIYDSSGRVLGGGIIA